MSFFRSRAILVVAISLMLSACSTSLISTIEPPSAGAIREGVPYRLPVAEVDITITRLLTRCEVWTLTFDAVDREKIVEVKNDKGMFIRAKEGSDTLVRLHAVDPEDATLSIPSEDYLFRSNQLELDFKVQVSHEVEFVDGELLSINPDAMADTFKTSSLAVAYHENTLQLSSVNATIEGQEAEAVGAGIKLATSVALIALGIPPVPLLTASSPTENPDGTRTKNFTVCSAFALANTKAYAATVTGLMQLTTQATNVVSNIDALNKKKEAGTASAADLAALTTLTQTAKNLENQIKDKEEEKIRLTKILSISYSRSDFRNVTASSDGTVAAPFTFEDKPTVQQLEKWLELLVPSYNDPKVATQILSEITVYGALAPFSNQYTCATACLLTYVAPGGDGEPSADNLRNGVLYRIPALALLLITTKDPVDRLTLIDAQRKQEGDLVFESVRIPQLGPVRSLPLSSDWGEKNNLTASFGKNGMPTAVAYTREVAPGVAALSAANDAAQAALSIRDQLNAADAATEAESASVEQAQIDALSRQIDLATKQAELEVLSLEPDQELVDLQAQLARLQLLAAIAEQEALLAGEE